MTTESPSARDLCLTVGELRELLARSDAHDNDLTNLSKVEPLCNGGIIRLRATVLGSREMMEEEREMREEQLADLRSDAAVFERRCEKLQLRLRGLKRRAATVINLP